MDTFYARVCTNVGIMTVPFMLRPITLVLAVLLLTSTVSPAQALVDTAPSSDSHEISELADSDSIDFTETTAPTVEPTVQEIEVGAETSSDVATNLPSDGPTRSTVRIDLHSDIVVVGVTWEADLTSPESVALRYRSDEQWTQWYPLEVDSGAENTTTSGTEPMAITNATAMEVTLHVAEANSSDGYTVNVIDPTASTPASLSAQTDERTKIEQSTVTPDLGARYSASAPPVSNIAAAYGIQINTRQAWGADESIRDDEDMAQDHLVTYNGAVVHHTASSNNYTKAQVPGIIQGFYRYHAITQGWGDIGYQLLVDRFGGVWEGRYGSLERTRLGAHARGGNFQTFGISVIGTFSDVAPPAAAQDATARAISWMFDTYNISNAKGSIWVPGSTGPGRMVDTISGHRQVSITACPGDAFFTLLPNMRNQVDRIINPTLSGKVTRLEGPGRFDTSANAALDTFPAGAATVFLASGSDYPDALAGGPAASLEGAPLLLTAPSALPVPIRKALELLNPRRIVILGGTESVYASVETELEGLSGVPAVERVGGDNRYETAAMLAESQFETAPHIYLASGENFPDALSAGPVAGANSSPLLLSGAERLPEATAQAITSLNPLNVTVLGGDSAISPEVSDEIAELTGATITRFAGVDRFDTSALVTRSVYNNTSDIVFIASGTTFPDALSGGPNSQRQGAPMLLVSPSGIPQPTQSALRELRPKKIIIIGGPAAISKQIERQLDGFITN